MIHSVIQKPLITEDDRVQFLGNSKYYMKIGGIQNIFFAGVDPFELWKFLAHRAASVSAGIVVDLYTTALFAYAYICAQLSGLAIHDTECSFFLLCAYEMV